MFSGSTRRLTMAAAGVLAVASLPSAAFSHDSDTEGHVPANTNYGFVDIGRDTLAGVVDGQYTDVWSHDGYAYVGTFQNTGCTTEGVYVVDIGAAIEGYSSDDESSWEGATVAHIPSAPDTRVNDVKVHTVGDTDVLIATQEPCGGAIPGSAPSGGEAPAQVGQKGISLYDVTDPTKPKSLKRNFGEFGGVHNTFAWTDAGGSYLIGVADAPDEAFMDTFIVDISKPQSPKLLVQTGILDWLDDGFSFDQLETGTFASIGLHDIWVDEIDGAHQAVLSYWDAGFITLDVSDPANPVFLGDSDYPDPDPITGLPYEGNAHAAVYGADGDLIYAGDEDFDPVAFAVEYGGETYPASGAAFGPPATDLAGELVYSGGEGCAVADIPAATGPDQIALIDRGSCFFQDKADNAYAQGYIGYVVANNQPGAGTITMGPRDDGPYAPIPGVMVSYEAGQVMQAGGPIAATEQFNGWGYLHVLNNTHGTMTVPTGGAASGETKDVGFLGELGYYAPAETVEEGFYDPENPIGDLTMHNVEADPSTQDIEPSYDAGPRMFVSWYSLGMRALEYRPGHFHTNANGEGSYSENVHEVGRFIAEDGSNFWGVHVDEYDGKQIILASDRNSGLWIFSFDCESDVEGPFYCQSGTD